MNIYDWLFESTKDTGYKPQLAWAGANKQALLWLPGNSWKGEEEVKKRIERATLKGCSQLAFPSYLTPQHAQPDCKICWVGIDCDEGPLDMSVLTECCHIFTGSIRASNSGKGRHLLFRLSAPINCSYPASNPYVRAITKPIVEWLESHGQPVCKADKRVFWLEGGKQEWLLKTDATMDVDGSGLLDTLDATERDTTEHSTGKGSWVNLDDLAPSIRNWVKSFQAAGCLPAQLRRNMPLNISRLVRLLRSNNERVETRSGLTSSTGTNGFVDLTEGSISLWSFADGHSIWRWTDCD